MQICISVVWNRVVRSASSFFCYGLFSLAIVSARPTMAQTVHAVLVGDRPPAAQWGKYVAAVATDLSVMGATLSNNIPESQLSTTRMEIEEDEQSDPKNIYRAVQDLRVTGNDTILFFYSGHGAADDEGQYFAMAKGKMYRKSLIDALKAKKARLVVLLTDCCNLRSDGFLYAAPGFRIVPPKAPTPLFRSLLFEPTGLIDITSSAPGESAFFAPIEEGRHLFPGSIFTQELTRWLDSNAKSRSNWDDLVRAVSLRVHTKFHTYYPNGASIAKGESVQSQQTVHPIQYPGMPESRGPRTGFVIRDFAGRGTVITEVTAGSPASQVYWIAKDKFVSLVPQQVIHSINGEPIANTEGAVKAVRESPQIMKMTVRDASLGTLDLLIRLNY